MDTQVTIPGRNLQFSCGSGETILEAAERAGWQLPYSCRRGTCASCEGTLLSGSVVMRDSGRRYTGAAKQVRLCQAVPTKNVGIEPNSVVKSSPPLRKRLAARVTRIEDVAGGVRILTLRFPIGERATFKAGQYLRVMLDDVTSRNYSLANPPRSSDGAQLHVRCWPGGWFSDLMLGKLQPGDTLHVDLPYGLLVLGERSAPTIMLATGTGFAPLQSMTSSLARGGNDGREVWLYWGMRTHDDLYAGELIERWLHKYPWFHFRAVFSREPDGGHAGRYVQHHALRDHPDLRAHEVYACGSEQMVMASRELLVGQGGLPSECFHADSFVRAADESAHGVPGTTTASRSRAASSIAPAATHGEIA